MDVIDEAVATAEREWRAYGIGRQDRAVLAADLRLELESAAADGVTPEQLLGSDLRSLARRLADEAAVPRVPTEYGRVMRTALAGAVLGACVGAIALILGYPILVAWFDLPLGFRMPVVLAVLLYYGAAAAFAVGGAATAVRTRLGELPRIRQTANAMLVLLPLAGAVVTPVTMGFASVFGYSTNPLVVAVEVALVAAAVAGATLLARMWSLRDRSGHGRPVAA